MTRLVILAILFPFCTASASISIESMSLEKALDTKGISGSFNYTHGPNHERLVGVFRNRTKNGIEVDVPPGTMFKAAQTNWQNHVIAKRSRFRLLPGKDTVVYFTAFCFERGDAGPGANSPFTLIRKKFSAGNRLCEMLDSLNDTGYSAQTAIWQLYARQTPNRIYGENKDHVMLLRNYVGAVLHMPVQEYRPRVYIKNVHTSPLRPTQFHTSTEYKLRDIKTSDQIEIKLFSYEQDQLLSNISYQTMLVQEKTLSRFIYGVKMGKLEPNNKYIVRVMKNGVVHEEWLYKTT